MAVEQRRGCGFRKAGGLYIVCDGLGEACERLPIPIKPCVVCGEQIKQTRSFQWAQTAFLLSRANPCMQYENCGRCVICNPELLKSEDGKVGFIWIGEQFYPTAQDWFKEAKEQGISRRIAALPKGFRIGETWVFAAHPKALVMALGEPEPAVVHVFKPNRIELIVTPSMKQEEWVQEYVKKGVTLVEVPEDDRDHAPKQKRKTKRQEAIEKITKGGTKQ